MAALSISVYLRSGGGVPGRSHVHAASGFMKTLT
jgi:hypothetical protein